VAVCSIPVLQINAFLGGFEYPIPLYLISATPKTGDKKIKRENK